MSDVLCIMPIVIRANGAPPPMKKSRVDERDERERREQKLFSPHRVVLVDCEIICRGLAPLERSATVFHELFAEIVLVESCGAPLTELLVKDRSCARLVRVTHWSSVPPPSILIAGSVFHFVGLCDNSMPADGTEPQFVCYWMSLASLLLPTTQH